MAFMPTTGTMLSCKWLRIERNEGEEPVLGLIQRRKR